VASDFKARQLDTDPLPEVYLPYERFPMIRSMRVVMRFAGPVGAMVRPVREVLAQVDATQPVYEFETLEQALDDSIAPRRFQLLLLEVFAAAALLLAVIGIRWRDGMVRGTADTRDRRTYGFASRGYEIVMLVVKQGMRLTLVGIRAGLLAAACLTRLMASLL